MSKKVMKMKTQVRFTRFKGVILENKYKTGNVDVKKCYEKNKFYPTMCSIFNYLRVTKLIQSKLLVKQL